MSGTNNDFLTKLIATFRLEADEHLQAMIAGLLALEKVATPDEQTPTLEIIFREAHSLKGAARAVNLTEVEAVCQALEGVFVRLKRRELHLVPEDFDTVHRALDTIRALLAEPDQPHAAHVAEAIHDLVRLETELHNNTSPIVTSTAKTQSSEESTLRASPEVPEYLDHVSTSSQTIPPIDSLDESFNLSPPTSSLASEASFTGSLSQAPQYVTSHPVGSNASNDFLGKLIATFRLEADEHLKAIVAGLLALEKATDPDDRQPFLETIFREVHSLKGASRAVDLTDVEAVCQALEGVLARLKRGEFQLSPEGFDAIHQALDTIEALLSEPNQPHATQIAEAVQRLTRLETVVTPKIDESTLSTQVVSLTQETNLRASFQDLGTGVSPIPSPLSLSLPSFPFEQPSASRTGHTAAPPGQGYGRGDQPGTYVKPVSEEVVRVTATKLDSLFLQVEEMLSAKLSINQHTTDLKETLGILGEWHKEWSKLSSEIRKLQRLIEAKDDGTQQGLLYSQTVPMLVDFLYWNERQFMALENRLKGLTKAAEHDQQTVGALVDSLLENTKRVLMMPFSSLLEIFPKMVRDLSRSLGKDVELLTTRE